MARYSGDVTETQIGSIGENLVATQLILESRGRLSLFKPMADDVGIDLLVYDKGTGVALPFQVKSRTKTLKRHLKIVHFQVRLATFNEEQEAYLLAVFVDAARREFRIKRSWLIPMRELPMVATRRAEKLAIRPSIDMKSQRR